MMNRVADVGAKFARWLGYITLGVLSFGLAGAATNIVMSIFGFTMVGLNAIAKFWAAHGKPCYRPLTCCARHY